MSNIALIIKFELEIILEMLIFRKMLIKDICGACPIPIPNLTNVLMHATYFDSIVS